MNPTESDSSRHAAGLSVAQEAALASILSGKTDAEAAEASGVTRQTVCEWLLHHTGFVAELSARRAGIRTTAGDRIRAATLKAVDVLVAQLDSKDARSRREAAIIFLKAVGLTDGGAVPDPVITEEELEASAARAEDVAKTADAEARIWAAEQRRDLELRAMLNGVELPSKLSEPTLKPSRSRRRGRPATPDFPSAR